MPWVGCDAVFCSGYCFSGTTFKNWVFINRVNSGLLARLVTLSPLGEAFLLFGSRVLDIHFLLRIEKKIIVFKDLRAPPMPRNRKKLEKNFFNFYFFPSSDDTVRSCKFFSRILKNSLLFAVPMGENFKLDFLER